MSKERLRDALEDDCRVQNVIDEMDRRIHSGFPRVPGAERKAAEYIAAVSGFLYDDLALALESPQAWREALLERLMEEKKPAVHAAALAYLAHLLYRSGESGIGALIERMTDADTSIVQEDVLRIIERFESTPLEGMFAHSQRRFPCMEDGEVRRLGMMLGAANYGRWISESKSGRQLQIEAADMGAMAVWGFGVAELMCAKKDGKPEGYARTVSLVALSSLSQLLGFDRFNVLGSCLESMVRERELFFAELKTLCREMELEAAKDGHVLVSDVQKEDYDEAAWMKALERCCMDAEGSVRIKDELQENDLENEGEQWETDDASE